jgi:hypothetical protein
MKFDAESSRKVIHGSLGPMACEVLQSVRRPAVPFSDLAVRCSCCFTGTTDRTRQSFLIDVSNRGLSKSTLAASRERASPADVADVQIIRKQWYLDKDRPAQL